MGVNEVYICTFQDDTGTICKREYGIHQHIQDGMCNRCAELLWPWYQWFSTPDTKEPAPTILFDKGP